ncbi:MAG: hypothetical protein LC623_02815, partial [Halobacteriales archaeon]|nr:hypothetical protein [Halobacteriales archaeon]
MRRPERTGIAAPADPTTDSTEFTESMDSVPSVKSVGSWGGERGHANSLLIHPGPANGTVAAPGSKSVTHRALLLAAQSQEPCRVVRPLLSAD